MIYLFLDSTSKEVLHKLIVPLSTISWFCNTNLMARYMKINIFEQVLLSYQKDYSKGN